LFSTALLRGVQRSKQRTMIWLRKAAETGDAQACMQQACGQLAGHMYADMPYARAVGHVEEAAGSTASAAVMEGHDVPPDVLTGVIHWLRKECGTEQCNVADKLDGLRRETLTGAKYCYNEGCKVVGPLKGFRVCPLCKTARYCGKGCQTKDWSSGGHKATCGTCEREAV